MTGSIIVINVDIRETRVALVEGGVIAELQIERASHRGTVGNVVLGKVTRVLPGMQAAFIDVGQERSAFLHVEDLIRPDDFEHYLAAGGGGGDDENESFRGAGGRKVAHQSDEDEEDDEEEERPASLNGAAEVRGPDSAGLDTRGAGHLEARGRLDNLVPEDEDDADELEAAGENEADAVGPEDAVGLEDAAGLEDAGELDDADEPDEVEDADDEDAVEDAAELESEDVDEDDAPDSADDDASDDASDSVADDDDPLADVPFVTDDDDDEPLLAAEPSAGTVTETLSAVSITVSEVEGAFGVERDVLSVAKVERTRTRGPVEVAGGAAAPQPAGRGGRGEGRDRARSGGGGGGGGSSGGGGGGESESGRGRRRGRGGPQGRGRRGRQQQQPQQQQRPEPGAEAKLVRGGRRSGPGRSGKNGGGRPEASVPPRVTRSVPITEVVKEGDHVVVQISKEPIGTKGARVTSHVSLPGRYVVYLPTVDHLGISKRIGSPRERQRLRQVMDSLKPARGGLIVRTVAEGLTKKQLKADVGYLIRVWAEVCKKRETARAAEVLYTELDLVLKVARDLFTDEVKTIVIDDREQYNRLVRFVEMFLPERVKDIELYAGSEPIFDAYGIEDEIGRALSRKVPLPSGGSLIVDQAEALTAIDVNTGRYVGKGSKDLEETALKTNLEAVEEIAYQLRFRNIGGLVILDLIDMEKYSNREKVWRALEAALVKDKAKTTLNRISELGLIEMTRKRTRESLGRMLHEPCFYCDGTGQIQSKATIAYEILRQIGRERYSLAGYSVVVNAHPAIVDFLKTVDRGALDEAERRYARRIELAQRTEYHIEQYDLQGK
jgi:ribonuclease G